MRVSCVLFAIGLPLAAQQTISNYDIDVNGRRTPGTAISSTRDNGNSARSESRQTINGRSVPLESVEEKVVREDSTGRVVERVVRRYSQDGHPGPEEKQRIEERKNADGSVSSVATTYRADINGRFELAERVTTEANKSGNTLRSTSTVERPTLNGSVEVTERRENAVTSDDNASHSDQLTYRKDVGGRFVETFRIVTDSKQQNGQTVENTASYEAGEGGRMQLHSQTVATAKKNPDGTEVREVDIYRRVPGRAEPSGAPPLEERQIIQQARQGDQLVETTLVQRPTVSDPNRLGPPRKIGEKICTGKCP